MLKKFFSACLASITCLTLVTGCGGSTSSVPSVSADLSYTQAGPETIPLSSGVQVVGLEKQATAWRSIIK